MNEDKIFQGNTPSKTRAYLCDSLGIIRSNYQSLVIPCCGGFSIAIAALEAGWKPEQITCSDVSLFSTVLAYAINEQPLDDLQIKSNGAAWGNSVAYADLLYELKLTMMQNQSRHYIQSVYVKDLIERKTSHIEKITKNIDALRLKLKGINYKYGDLFVEAGEALENKSDVIWINPPGYKRGYARMFDTGGRITWAEPLYEDFTPNKDHDRLRQMSSGKPALMLWYRYNETAPEDKPYVVFADQKGRKRWDFTLCNRPDEIKSLIVGRSSENQHYSYAVLPSDYEIKTTSQVGFKPVDSKQALYYRDLFIHRLGLTLTQRYHLLVIDSFVAGVVGCGGNYGAKIQSNFDLDVEEGFGMTAPSKRHPKLNRLLMMLIKTRTFLDQFKTLQFYPTGLATTCLSQYPELKINRGIYELIGRMKMPGGMFKLRYRADMTEFTYSEVLAQWLKRYN